MKKQVKTSGVSIIVNHQPGATTIATVDTDSLGNEETGRLVMEAQIRAEESQIVEQRFIRVSDSQNLTQEETSRSINITNEASPTVINKQDQGVVWMSVRHSKKLFHTAGGERVIALPMVNKLPSGNFSPTENLDFDFENDGEMFDQRRKDDSPADYHTSTFVTELEQVEEISGGSRGFREESLMVRETDKDAEHEFGSGHEPLECKITVTERGSEDVDLSPVNTPEREVVGNEEIPRRSEREIPTVADGTITENNVWCTVKMKRWESDIRGINWSKQSRGDASELSSSTASIDGSYKRDTSRARSPNSEFSIDSESKDAWISIRQKRKPDVNANMVSIKSSKDSKIVKRSSSRSTVGDKESVGYSMQITATDDGPLMTQEEILSTVDTLDTESTQSTNMGDVTILPWIQVQKRDSMKQRLSFKKNKRDASLKGIPHTTEGNDRLLLLKIPRTTLFEMENDEKMLDTEVEIPWMELDQSTGKLGNTISI